MDQNVDGIKLTNFLVKLINFQLIVSELKCFVGIGFSFTSALSSCKEAVLDRWDCLIICDHFYGFVFSSIQRAKSKLSYSLICIAYRCVGI